MFSGASWQMFWLTTDAARYQCYALTFWLGSSAVHLLPAGQCQFLHITSAQPPFSMLPQEYPPFTLLPFSLALLAPVQYFQLSFAFWMGDPVVLSIGKATHVNLVIGSEGSGPDTLCSLSEHFLLPGKDLIVATLIAKDRGGKELRTRNEIKQHC